MDDWAWQELQPWLASRLELPVGPLFGVITRATRGRRWSSAAARLHHGQHAAVDVERVPVHEIRSGRAQEQQRADEVVDGAPTRGRSSPAQPPAEVRIIDERSREFGLDVARRERIDLQTGRRPVRAHALGEHLQAPLVAAYGATPGRARADCTDAMLMILPRPRATMPRATSRPTKKALVKFVSSSRYHSASGNSSSGHMSGCVKVCGQLRPGQNADDGLLATFGVQPQSLAGTRWVVVDYNNGKQAVVSVLAGTKLTADFDTAGHMAGFAGCNDYSGPVKATPPEVSIGPLATRGNSERVPE